MTLQDEYQVKLDTFCGPLDLLLYLIRRAEVDIHDIPIAEITDQYMQVLRQVEHVDIEAAGEFLVMAATLMEVKSRTLMPPEAQQDDGDGADGVALQEIEVTPGAPADPRFELVRQLYAAFAAGDEATLRQLLAPDVEWNQCVGFPGGALRRGVESPAIRPQADSQSQTDLH